jgi:cbb3-type cytochrome oxidase maturation protein
MESLFFLIPIALVFCAVAIRLLLWAIDSGQYEDLDKEGWRVLNDDGALSGADDEPTADEESLRAPDTDRRGNDPRC